MNLRPPGYEPDELPDCSTPRRVVSDDKMDYTIVSRKCQGFWAKEFTILRVRRASASLWASRTVLASPSNSPSKSTPKISARSPKRRPQPGAVPVHARRPVAQPGKFGKGSSRDGLHVFGGAGSEAPGQGAHAHPAFLRQRPAGMFQHGAGAGFRAVKAEKFSSRPSGRAS